MEAANGFEAHPVSAFGISLVGVDSGGRGRVKNDLMIPLDLIWMLSDS